MMEKQKKLVSALLKRTQEGELDWNEAVVKGAFQVSLKDNSVRIRAVQADPETVDYEVSLINADGKVVDTFTDLEACGTEEYDIGKRAVADAFRDLYDIARRTALGSEKILNEILAEVDDEIPF